MLACLSAQAESKQLLGTSRVAVLLLMCAQSTSVSAHPLAAAQRLLTDVFHHVSCCNKLSALPCCRAPSVLTGSTVAPAQTLCTRRDPLDRRAHLQGPTVSTKGCPACCTVCTHCRPCPSPVFSMYWTQPASNQSCTFNRLPLRLQLCLSCCLYIGVLGPQVKRRPQGSGGAGRGAGGQVGYAADPPPHT